MAKEAPAWPELNALVRVTGEPWDTELASRVEDVADGNLVLAAPSLPDDPVGRPVLPAADTPVTIFWTHERGLCQLPGAVVATDREAPARWHVRPVQQVKSLQRRDHVRVPLLVEITVRHEAGDLKARTVDLSEGGLRFIAAADVGLRAGDKVDVDLHLQDSSIATCAELLRTTPTTEGLVEVTGRFVTIQRGDADRLRKRLFAEQIAQRARERRD